MSSSEYLEKIINFGRNNIVLFYNSKESAIQIMESRDFGIEFDSNCFIPGGLEREKTGFFEKFSLLFDVLDSLNKQYKGNVALDLPSITHGTISRPYILLRQDESELPRIAASLETIAKQFRGQYAAAENAWPAQAEAERGNNFATLNRARAEQLASEFISVAEDLSNTTPLNREHIVRIFQTMRYG